MKSFSAYLLIGGAALFLLCPQVSDAQRTGKKVKPVPGKVAVGPKPVSKVTAVPRPRNAEPSEDEMKEALIKGMEARGGERRPDGSVEINNALAGSIVKIESFSKLGCKPTTTGAGYSCTYKVTMSMKVRSNDGTMAGDRQAAAWNTLLGGVGAQYTTATATKRFVRAKEGWAASDE